MESVTVTLFTLGHCYLLFQALVSPDAGGFYSKDSGAASLTQVRIFYVKKNPKQTKTFRRFFPFSFGSCQ